MHEWLAEAASPSAVERIFCTFGSLVALVAFCVPNHRNQTGA
jgi:energy-converting hydrogenase Eha subunit F